MGAGRAHDAGADDDDVVSGHAGFRAECPSQTGHPARSTAWLRRS
jgi:hypothetical protein